MNTEKKKEEKNKKVKIPGPDVETCSQRMPAEADQVLWAGW